MIYSLFQVRVGDTPALGNTTGNPVCAEIGNARPATNRVDLHCCAWGRYIVMRKKISGWWTINEMWATLDSKHSLSTIQYRVASDVGGSIFCI